MIATMPPVTEVVTVQAGQTLSSIAASHGESWQSLYALNREEIPNPNDLYVGEKLRVAEVPPAGRYREVCTLTVDASGNGSLNDCTITVVHQSAPPAPPVQAEPSAPPSAGNVQPTVGQGGGYAPMPVGSAAMWECIERAESSDNPRSVNQLPGGSGGGLFGDLASTWADYDGYAEPYDAPVSVQVTFNAQLYREDGYQPWDDPCTGRNGA